MRQIFEEMAMKCPYGDKLAGKLLNWGGPKPGTVWDLLENQIKRRATQESKTPEQFIDYLFEALDANAFMQRLGT
jgi:hypothetical protein